MRFFGHIVRKTVLKKTEIGLQGKVEGDRRRSKPANTWFNVLKEWTKLDIADASQLATDREIWHELITVTSAQKLVICHSALPLLLLLLHLLFFIIYIYIYLDQSIFFKWPFLLRR